MILPDVNVLVYSYREDSADHKGYRDWLDETVASPSSFGLSDLVLSGFMRVVTHPRVFEVPTPIAQAVEFVEALRGQANVVTVKPGDRHFEIFCQLCTGVNCNGNLVPDAYLAALAIEYGCELLTTDHDFARFPDLKWRHPLRSVCEK